MDKFFRHDFEKIQIEPSNQQTRQDKPRYHRMMKRWGGYYMQKLNVQIHQIEDLKNHDLEINETQRLIKMDG